MKFKGIIAILTSAFGFALMAACVRLCDDYGASISCFEKSFFRNFVALVIAAVALMRWKRGAARATPALYRLDPKHGFILSLRCVLGTIGIFANFYALTHIPIADGQTLNKTAPFFTVLFAWLFLRERTSLSQFAAITVAFAGTILVAKPGFAGGDAFALTMGLLGGVCAGGAYAALRSLGRFGMPPVLIVFAFSAFSCFASLPFTFADFVLPTWAQLAALMGAGFGAAVGQFGITAAYRFARPNEIAVYDYFNIPCTAAFGYFLFGQISDALSMIGIVVIVFAAICLNLKSRCGGDSPRNMIKTAMNRTITGKSHGSVTRESPEVHDFLI